MKKSIPIIPFAFVLTTLSGVLLSAAWPAKGFPGLLFFALVPMFLAEKYLRENTKNNLSVSFLAFWWGFLIFNFLTTYWIYFATDVGSIAAWVCNSMFMALVWYAYAWLQKNRDARIAIWGLITTWIGFEFGHMRWDLTWPWLTIGNAFANFPEWVQWYEITGTLGGSLWVLVVNWLLFQAIFQFSNKSYFRKKLIIAISLICLPIIASYIRYATYKDADLKAEIVVVQPNIDPYSEKFSTNGDWQLQRLIKLGFDQATPNTKYIICPETAIPYGIWKHYQDDSEEIDSIRNHIKKFPQLSFLTGLTYLVKYPADATNVPMEATQNKRGEWVIDYNSSMNIDTSRNLQFYHKSKLVPGPERLPFQRFLKPFQESIFDNLGPIGNMGTQPYRSVFYNPDSTVIAAPVICYESIFGDYVTDYVKIGANFIAIITNDGWWRDTPGYKQHFQYARLRAIENRRSVARSANTGISGFINERGDIIQQSNWDEAIALRHEISLNNKKTIYTEHGDIIGRMAFFGAILLLVFQKMKIFLKKKKSIV